MTLTHELGWLQPHFQGLVLKGEALGTKLGG